MLISFDCPKCLKIARNELSSASPRVSCSDCGWTRPIGETDMKGESPARCLVCGCDDLWRQKDFDQRLGVFIVGIGILLSTIAVAYMMPGVAMIILMAFGLADWVLYAILPDRLVCYRCHSQYRRIPNLAEAAAFDLEVNERYRQEAIRLKQAEQMTKR
jgi:hypothetical protein